MNHALVVAVLLLGISGCAVNGFERYYSPLPGSEAAAKSAWIEHSTGDPKIYTYSSDLNADNQRVQEEGYLAIGSSSFYGPPKTMTKAQLVKQAKKVGASLVLVHSQYKDTISGVVPYTVPNPTQVSTVNTSGTVNSYGSAGYASGTYSGQSTIVTPGGSTTYAMPYSVSRNDTLATFWVHSDPSKIRLGVNYGPLPEPIRVKLQRNTGLVVLSVIRGTPAFSANILRDDIILKIAGEDVIDQTSFDKQVTKFEGQRVEIELMRGDAPKTVAVTLNRRAQ